MTVASKPCSVLEPLALPTNKSHADAPVLVNRWNDFDQLEEIMVGVANDACFPPLEPACQLKKIKNIKIDAKMIENGVRKRFQRRICCSKILRN